jgi:RNA polymerase sigma-70 factor (ECF subfamily)
MRIRWGIHNPKSAIEWNFARSFSWRKEATSRRSRNWWTNFMRRSSDCSASRPDESFKTWIYKIAMNLANDHYAESQRAVAVELDESFQEQIQSPSDAAEKVGQRQLLQQIYRVIPQLTARERSVLVLKAMEGLENDEIARVLGVTQTTVRRFYGLARRKILRLLEQQKSAEGST